MEEKSVSISVATLAVLVNSSAKFLRFAKALRGSGVEEIKQEELNDLQQAITRGRLAIGGHNEPPTFYRM